MTCGYGTITRRRRLPRRLCSRSRALDRRPSAAAILAGCFLGSRTTPAADAGPARPVALFHRRRSRCGRSDRRPLDPARRVRAGRQSRPAALSLSIANSPARLATRRRSTCVRHLRTARRHKGCNRRSCRRSVTASRSPRSTITARRQFAGKAFAALDAVQQDQVLGGLENGEIELKDGNGKAFFEAILANTMEGFFADPIYGGNRDMAGWKLIGFPGARYDYRDHVSKHNRALSAAAGLDPRAQRLVGPRLKAES